MKKLRFSLLPNPVKILQSFMRLAVFAGVTVCSISTLRAQTDSLVSAAITPPAPSDVITFATGQAIRGRSTAGRFAPVPLNPLATAAIKLQFAAATLANTPVIVQALDGGALGLSNESATIAADGTTAFQFQAADQPGLYRILIIAGEAVAMVQFEVPSQTAEE